MSRIKGRIGAVSTLGILILALGLPPVALADDQSQSTDTTQPEFSAESADQVDSGQLDSESQEPEDEESADSLPEPNRVTERSMLAAQADAAGPMCRAGYVYALGYSTSSLAPEYAQVIEIAPDGSTSLLGPRVRDTEMGAWPVGSGRQWNAFGMAPDGQSMYAIARLSDQRVRLWMWSADTNSWGTKPVVDVRIGNNVTGNGFNGDIIAGGVNPVDGTFVYGGYDSTSAARNRKFMIWAYDPVSKTNTYKGYFPIEDGETGDLAFDTVGSLYLISGHASTTATHIYTVKHGDYAASEGGEMKAQRGSQLNFVMNVGGIAFSADGKIFAAGTKELFQGDMPNMGGVRLINRNIFNGYGSNWRVTDAASCSFPPTVTLQKNIAGTRAHQGEQFHLTLEDRSVNFKEETVTRGNEPGIQEEQVGPIVTVPGKTFTFTEDLVSGEEWLYNTTFECKADGKPLVASEVKVVAGKTQREASVSIPAVSAAAARGSEVICQFVNTPNTAQIKIHKDVLVGDEEMMPKPGWQVGAAISETGVALVPATQIQSTDQNGDALWDVNFGSAGAGTVAEIKVSEFVQDDLNFVSGQCQLDRPGKATQTIELDPELVTVGQGIEIQSGDVLICNYLNGTSPQLTLCKEVVAVPGGLVEASGNGGERRDWMLFAQRLGGDHPDVTSDDCATSTSVDPGRYQLSEKVSETPVTSVALANTYLPIGNWVCEARKVAEEWSERPLAQNTLSIERTDRQVSCRIANQAAEITILTEVNSNSSDQKVTAADFHISAAARDDEIELPKLEAAGNPQVTADNTFLVRPQMIYHVQTQGPSHLRQSFQKYQASAQCPANPTAASLGDKSCWTDADQNAIVVGQGERGIYRFTNVVPDTVTLPFSGGPSAIAFSVLGVILAGAGIAASILIAGRYSGKHRR